MLDAWLRSTYRDVGLLLLTFFLILGCVYAFLMPPFQVPDERAHWLTAHHHLARALTGSGNVCSTDVALDRHFQLGIKFQPERKLPTRTFARVKKLRAECEEKLLYPTGNLLSYPGVLMTRLFVPREPTSGHQSLFGFYLARLLHGLLIALLLLRIWWLARAGPGGPPGLLALLLLALTPLFVQQSFGITIDVVTNAFALSVCSWLVFSERLTGFDRGVLLVLGAITTLGKPVLSGMLLPLLILGLYLEQLRLDPDAAGALLPSLKQRIAGHRAFAAAVTGIALLGMLYAQDFSLASGRAARQLDSMSADPWRALTILGGGVWHVFSHPSFFLDYLGYLDIRISAATLRDFTLLAILVGALEALAIGTGIVHVARSPDRRRALRRAARPVALLGTLALVAVAVGVLLVALHAYLVFTRTGSERIASLQPRYLFPHLIVTLGVAMALGRTLLGAGASPRPAGRLSNRVGAAALVLVGLLLSGFVAHLSMDLLARYG